MTADAARAGAPSEDRLRLFDPLLLRVVRGLAYLTAASGVALRWSVANPVAVLTTGGVLVYGLLYLAYASFYSAFGLQPEEAGLGYKDILSRAPGMLVLLLLLGLILVGLCAVLCVLWWIAVDGGRWVRLISRRVPAHPSLGSFVSFSAVYSMVGALALVVAVSISFERQDAGKAYWEGTPVAPGLVNPGYVATPAAVTWLKPARHHRETVLYLGQTTDTYVLYDPRTRKTLEVPDQAVILSLHEPCTGACARYARTRR